MAGWCFAIGGVRGHRRGVERGGQDVRGRGGTDVDRYIYGYWEGEGRCAGGYIYMWLHLPGWSRPLERQDIYLCTGRGSSARGDAPGTPGRLASWGWGVGHDGRLSSSRCNLPVDDGFASWRGLGGASIPRRGEGAHQASPQAPQQRRDRCTKWAPRFTSRVDAVRKSGPILVVRTDHPIVKPFPQSHFSTG